MFKEKLGKELLFFDGGTGTIFQENGLKPGELPEKLNIENKELVEKVHTAYLEAGADIITTNTFGANSLKFDNVDEIVSSAGQIARNCADKFGKMVALDLGPTGKLLKPMGELDFEKAIEIYSEVVNAGKEYADLIIIETMSDTYEIKAAVLAAKENSNLPVVVTMIFDEKGRLLTGADIKTATSMLEGLGVDAIGFNCGLGPVQMKELLPVLQDCTSLPIVVNPNAGLPESINGKTVFNVKAKEFADIMKDFDVAVLGGCCGTTPEHIKALIDVCKNKKPVVPKKKNETIVSSYSKSVTIGNMPVVIGERINPTGKKRFKEALRENDIDYILKEGLNQADKGANILDVNVGLPEIDEPKMMLDAITSLQSVINLPLQIDTSDIKAMEVALRNYNGKAMLNSVNGKAESMESVFPLAKKYGAVIVCLTLDENGIPETAKGRIEIAKKIINTAMKYGIDKKDLVIDTLAMTISTNKDGAIETLKALNYIKKELGVNTVLGVSNVSFGLPNREAINTAFFTLAMENGLSCGIINPLSASMMNAYYSYCALKGFDDNCTNYINFATNTDAKVEVNKTATLQSSIINGMKDDAALCAKQLLDSTDSMNIINEHIIPALDIVGKGFEENKIFLPQLLMSADAAKASFDEIKSYLVAKGTKAKKGNKIIVATVYGDIHDIGKNIVKVLLENYGFDVIDLGKDVPPETVLECVIDNNVKLVGLSALMTTTVPSMEKTIELLHQNTDAKVFVGGAVLTKNYADMINADKYTKDAMASVEYAKEFFRNMEN